jgi:DMSO reductase anchor subunit
MHPALSVIFFTVLSGAGFGLVIIAALLSLLAPQIAGTGATVAAGALGLVLATAGLLASTLHLANPKNAWRAFSRFRSSWLSREAVFSVAFYPFAVLWLAGLWFPQLMAPALVAVAAVVTVVLALATIFSTGMIYASLRSIPTWHSPLVPTNYLLLSFASGSLLMTVVAAVAGTTGREIAGLTLVLLALAGVGKAVYYYWIGRPRGPSINTATGMTRGQVRLLESGQSSRTFLDKEFRHSVSAQRLLRLRLVVGVVGFLIPIALVAVMLRVEMVALALLAMVAAFAGLAVERWLFFAEARHVVNLFYGQQRV